MFKRIRRSRFDEFPDMLVAAVSATSAPRVEETGGLHLQIFYVSGSQLDELKKKLEGEKFQDDASLKHPDAVDVMYELSRCSGLYIVSTSVELLVVSDGSKVQYRAIEELYANLLPLYVDLNKGCALAIKKLHSLSG